MTNFRQVFAFVRRRHYVVQGVAVIGAVAAVAAGAAQQVGSSRTALAAVLDAQNKPIVDIDADDFVVQEAGQPREILSVHVADYPVVVMVDTGAAAQNDLPLIQKAVNRFVERIGEQRPLALGAYSDRAEIVAGFDAERPQLKERLAALTVNATASSFAMEGAAAAARTLAPTHALFSAVVLVSAAGGDERPRAEDAVGTIVGSGAMVHVIANRANGPGKAAAPAGMPTPLRAVADQTHGGYVTIYNAASYQAALEQLANRLATELMVEYLVPNESHAADVKLGVRMPGVRVRGLGVAPR